MIIDHPKELEKSKPRNIVNKKIERSNFNRFLKEFEYVNMLRRNFAFFQKKKLNKMISDSVRLFL